VYAVDDQMGWGPGNYEFYVEADGYNPQFGYRTWNGSSTLTVNFALAPFAPPPSINIEGLTRFHTAVAASQEAYPTAASTSSSPRAATGPMPLAAPLWQELSTHRSC
jgi:hypothetical protein